MKTLEETLNAISSIPNVIVARPQRYTLDVTLPDGQRLRLSRRLDGWAVRVNIAIIEEGGAETLYWSETVRPETMRGIAAAWAKSEALADLQADRARIETRANLSNALEGYTKGNPSK